jgi:hypothetical protein
VRANEQPKDIAGKKYLVLAALTAVAAVGIAGPAQAAVRPLSLKGASEVMRLNANDYANWKMDDGDYDDWTRDPVRCRRVKSTVVDCQTYVRVYESDPDDPSLYVSGEECNMRMRLRRTEHGTAVYDSRMKGYGGDPSSTPCRDI